MDITQKNHVTGNGLESLEPFCAMLCLIHTTFPRHLRNYVPEKTGTLMVYDIIWFELHYSLILEIIFPYFILYIFKVIIYTFYFRTNVYICIYNLYWRSFVQPH